MTAREKYEEYLSSDEISKYLENGMKYLELLNIFCEERRYPAACFDGRYGTSSSASAEVFKQE